MKVLLNYDKNERDHLSVVAHIFRQMGVQAVSSAANMQLHELVDKAKIAGCQAILMCNTQTLRNMVPGDTPTLDMWRGSRLNYEMPAIIINKLAHIHTVPHGKWLLEKDLEKLRWIRVAPRKFSYTKLLTKELMDSAYEQMRSAVFIAYDVETQTPKTAADSLEGQFTFITCASWTAVYATGETKTWVLPLIDYQGEHWKDEKDYTAAYKFARKVNSLRIPKAMHNGMYDATHSIIHNIEPHYYILDTMGLMHAEYSELPKDLAFTASTVLYDYVQWKHDADLASKQKDQEKYWAYNAKDTWHTALIAIEQLRKSQSYTFTNYARTFPLVYPSLYGNFEGFKIDQAKRAQLRETAEIKLKKAKRNLQTMAANLEFNPGSWQQVSFLLYDVFGAKNPKIGKSASGTDEKNLKAVSEQHPLLARIADEILDYRDSQKAIGTYYDFLQMKGRLLWALDPFGTETTRMACKASSLWCGTQVQNVPGYAKTMLIADEGFEIFEADNKQSEGRTTAYCSQEEALIAALEDAEKDFYKTLGTLFFEMPYEEVTDFFRNKVLKRIVHGTNYMMGAKTFIENIGVRILLETAGKLGLEIVDTVRANRPEQRTLRGFAKDLLDAYHKPFPRVRLWYQEIRSEIASTGMLVSPLGQTRRFFGNIERDHNMLRSAVAHQPQQISVEILNKGFRRAYREICLPSNGDFRLKAQVHDSILGQWRIERRDEFAAKLAACMYNPVKIHGRTLVIPIDIKTGQNWAEQEADNLSGTVKYKGLK
jgi:DNA polymerase I-like protein with 3'-5' exonuclease and polymerase domains